MEAFSRSEKFKSAQSMTLGVDWVTMVGGGVYIVINTEKRKKPSLKIFLKKS